MDIRTLLDRVDIIENNQPSIKKYLSESLYNTPEMQPHWKRIDEGFIRGYEQYLAEVALTPDQIQNIFKQASGGAAGGEAAKDPGKLAALVDKVLPSSQAANLEKTLPEPDAGPVQGFEQKASAAVQNLQGVDSGTKQSLMQMVKAGIQKPETQQLILAAVGAGLGSLISKVGPILSMIPGGGPVAAAITGAVVAGGVAVLAAKLRGDDWKTAFKGAIKPALMGGASAVVGNLVTTAVGAMTSSSSTPDQGQPPGAQVGVGDKMPDGSEVTGLDGGQVTVTHPDGTSETMSNQDYYGRTGQQGIADPNAPAASDKSHRKLPQWAQELQDKQKSIDDFAGKMGLPPGKHDVQMQGGVPVSIDGQPVPQDLYTPAQQRNIQAAQQMSASMNGGSQSSTPADTSAPAEQPKVRANLDQWRTDTGSPNAPQADAGQITPKGGVTLPNPDGSYPPGAFTADDQIALNQRMQAQMNNQSSTSDYPSAGKVRPSLDQWRADNAASGATAGGVPIGSTPDGINRLTGQPIQPAPSWDQMTPDQQAATIAKQTAERDALRGGRSYADHLNDLAAQGIKVRGLKESFSESKYVDKQATLRKWLVQEARGQRVHGLALKPIVKEGIMDSIKGMFGGGKKGDAPAAGGITADALNKAWAAAGSPTDSEEVAKVLQSAGVPAETVTKVFTDLKLPPPGAPAPAGEEPAAPEAPAQPTASAEPEAAKEPAAEPAPSATAGGVNIDDLAAQINKLAPADKQKVMAALQG